jgi:hypothetical protein
MGKGKDPKVLLAEREPVVIIVEEDVTHKAQAEWRLHVSARGRNLPLFNNLTEEQRFLLALKDEDS